MQEDDGVDFAFDFIRIQAEQAFSSTDDHDDGGCTPSHTPLYQDVRAFNDYHGDDDAVGIVGLKKKHEQGQADPQFVKHWVAWCDVGISPW